MKDDVQQGTFYARYKQRRRHYPIAPERCVVDLLHDDRDKLCFTLLSLGWTTEVICLKTGYTTSQVAYRARRFDITRSGYRKGSNLAESVVDIILKQRLLNKEIAIRGDRISKNLDIKVLKK